MKKYVWDSAAGMTVTLAIVEARAPGLEHSVRVLRLDVHDERGSWCEEFTSEAEADLWLSGCRAGTWMAGKTNSFPASVQQIINFGKAVECEVPRKPAERPSVAESLSASKIAVVDAELGRRFRKRTAPERLPTTLPLGTVFRVTWPTGKTGLRETYDKARLEGEVYVVGDGHPAHSQRFRPDEVVWDEEESAECKRKLRIAEEVR